MVYSFTTLSTRHAAKICTLFPKLRLDNKVITYVYETYNQCNDIQDTTRVRE
jgi:hypothetical protein